MVGGITFCHTFYVNYHDTHRISHSYPDRGWNRSNDTYLMNSQYREQCLDRASSAEKVSNGSFRAADIDLSRCIFAVLPKHERLNGLIFSFVS